VHSGGERFSRVGGVPCERPLEETKPLLGGHSFFSALLRHLGQAMMALVLLMACGPGRLQADTVRADAVVLVNSTSGGYSNFDQYIKPYLDNFGVPYTVQDISTNRDTTSISNYAVIIIGHTNLNTTGAYLNAEAQRYLTDAVSNGTGLVSFDAALFANDGTPRYDFSQSIFGFTFPNGTFIASTNVGFPVTETGGTNLHFITALHANTNSPSVTCHTDASLRLPGFISPAKVTVVVTNGGGAPLVAVTHFGQGRAVQWTSYDWVAPEVIGPLGGLDDLVWRSIVWAARKPFVMRGMPHFVTMRIDDVQGDSGDDPFWRVNRAIYRGFKPWLGLYLGDTVATNATKIGKLATILTNTDGSATANVHAYDDTTFFWFDHNHSTNFPDSVMSTHLDFARQWFKSNGITPSKVLMAHWSEMGPNAFPGLKTNLNVEFPFLKNEPGTVQDSPWLLLGPYRSNDPPRYSGFTNWPVFYADFLHVPGHEELYGQFFNCGTEMRDSVANEWNTGSTNPIVSIRRGTQQLKVALDSMALATLYTHEDKLAFDTDSWDRVLRTITNNLVDYHPLYVTLDYACEYLRATRTSRLVSSTYDPLSGQVNATFTNITDLEFTNNPETYVYTFIGQDNGITTLTGTNAASPRAPTSPVPALPPGFWVHLDATVSTVSNGLATVEMQARPLGGGGQVNVVEFFEETIEGTNKLGEVGAPPYVFWTNFASGIHHLTARATDSLGQSADSSVDIHVVGSLDHITVTSPTNKVCVFGQQRFTAMAKDAWEAPLDPQPAFEWSVSGGGTIDSNGLFKAGWATNAQVIVTACADGRCGTTNLQVFFDGMEVNEGQMLSLTNTATSFVSQLLTNTIHFTYAGRSALTNDGWSFVATRADGSPRDTENTNPPSLGGIDYDQNAHTNCIMVPCDKGDLWDSLGNTSNNTTNSLFRTLPTNWVSLQLSLSFAPKIDNQQVHLSLYQDDDRYVQVGASFNSTRGGNGVSVGYQQAGGFSGTLTSTPTRATNFVFGAERDLTNNTVTLFWGTDWKYVVPANLLPTNPCLGVWVGGSTSSWTAGMANVALSNLDIVVVTNVPRTLTYALSNPPAGASIDPNTGVITWTPTKAQGPNFYDPNDPYKPYELISLAVDSDGIPVATTTNWVRVNEINTAPILPVLPDKPLAVGQTLVVTNTAADSDLPPNPLTYVLLQAPLGARIDDTNGVITWTPTPTQVPSTNLFTTVVTDNNMWAVNDKQLSATNSFTVFVLSPPVLGARSTGTSLVFFWADSWTNCVLESATNLAPGTVWTPVTNVSESAAGTFSVPLVPDAPQQFFRLRLPNP
jgi:hypothetical protein